MIGGKSRVSGILVRLYIWLANERVWHQLDERVYMLIRSENAFNWSKCN